MLEVAASVVLDSEKGSLAAQLAHVHEEAPALPRFMPGAPDDAVDDTPPLERPADLLFDNGHGGFTADGREYVIHLVQRPRESRIWHAGHGIRWRFHLGREQR